MDHALPLLLPNTLGVDYQGCGIQVPREHEASKAHVFTECVDVWSRLVHLGNHLLRNAAHWLFITGPVLHHRGHLQRRGKTHGKQEGIRG